MQIDFKKASLGGAWLLGLGGIAVSDIFTSGSGRALVFGFGLVPVAIMWMFWTPPQMSLSEAISKVRE